MSEDDGRESMVQVRAVPEGRFAAMLRALADVQSHSSDARSVSYGATGSGGLREVTASERAIDAGTVGRGRRAWARLAATSGEAHRTLTWLVVYARTGDVASLAVHYAAQAAPVALRTARERAQVRYDAAAAHAARASTAHESAKRVAVSRAPEAVAALIAAKGAAAASQDALTSAAATLARAEGELRAWGVAAMGAALGAWEDAGEECAA